MAIGLARLIGAAHRAGRWWRQARERRKGAGGAQGLRWPAAIRRSWPEPWSWPRWPADWRIAWRLLAFCVPVVLLGIAAFVAACAFEIPIDGGVQGGDTSASAVLFKAADGSELATRGIVHGDKLSADELPQNLKQAIVAIEDRRFYTHGALDFHGMARAMFRDLFKGSAREGASTITQQLARLMLLSPDRTLTRKVQEALIAVWLEHHLTKPEILARYLDTAYFGAGAYGADAAARRYFGKSARDLTLPEAAMIAGLVRAPSQLAPHRNLDAAQARAKLVLRAMAATGAITRAEADAAEAHPATLKVSPETPSGSGYVADVAAGDVKALVGDAALDLSASTTIDADLQDAAEQAAAAHLDAEGQAKHVSQAALVAIGADGAILAMVGGRDYDESAFNRATQARRQPGSLFKLFVYLTALQQGATPDTSVTDRPVRIGNWEPHNFEDSYRGTIPLHLAFAHSINTVAAQLAQQVGIKSVIKTAHDLGVQSTLPAVPSLALGTAEVTLMEMTRAFATVASDQLGQHKSVPRATPTTAASDKTVPAAAKAASPAPAPTTEISGDADVIDTATLNVDGREVHLQGIAPLGGRPARALARHLRRRDVSCTPAGDRMFRCLVDGDDLATTILVNGGSSATSDAPADLVAAQDAAQNNRRGIWRHRR